MTSTKKKKKEKADHNIILLKHKQNLQENGCIVTKKKKPRLPKAQNNKLDTANQAGGGRGQRGNVNTVTLFLGVYIYKNLYIHTSAPNIWYSQRCHKQLMELLNTTLLSTHSRPRRPLSRSRELSRRLSAQNGVPLRHPGQALYEQLSPWLPNGPPLPTVPTLCPSTTHGAGRVHTGSCRAPSSIAPRWSLA